MKKTKLLIATLVCAVMLMGVGYAWWTDSITLGADVAAGHMNVIWDNEGILPIYGASPWVTKTLDIETAKDIKLTFSNLYPGAEAFVDAVASNESTIPVKMSQVSLLTSGSQDLLNSIYACGYYFRTNKQGSYISGSFGILPYAPLANLDDNIYNAFKNVTLNPGDKIFFGIPENEEEVTPESKIIEGYDGSEECIIFCVNPLAEEEIEDQNATVTLKFDWKQFNKF